MREIGLCYINQVGSCFESEFWTQLSNLLFVVRFCFKFSVYLCDRSFCTSALVTLIKLFINYIPKRCLLYIVLKFGCQCLCMKSLYCFYSSQVTAVLVDILMERICFGYTFQRCQLIFKLFKKFDQQYTLNIYKVSLWEI